MADFIVTTTPNVEGYMIEKYCGIVGEDWAYRSNCRIKTFKTPVFLGDFVRQGAWEKN